MQIMFSRKYIVHRSILLVRMYLKEITDAYYKGYYSFCEQLYCEVTHKISMLHHLGIMRADNVNYLLDIVSAYYFSLV